VAWVSQWSAVVAVWSFRVERRGVVVQKINVDLRSGLKQLVSDKNFSQL